MPALPRWIPDQVGDDMPAKPLKLLHQAGCAPTLTLFDIRVIFELENSKEANTILQTKAG